MSTKPALKVGFILTRQFTLSAFANFVDVLRLAADEGDRSRPIRCSWKVLSATMNPVVSSCGIPVQPDQRLGDPRAFDYMVVVGGLIPAIQDLNPDYIAYLKRTAEANVPIVGVCTGAFILHQAGLMEGYRCCVSWFHHNDFLEQFEGLIPVSDQIFVVDRDRLTCSGGASSAHLAAFLVDRHIGQAAARKSLNIMIIDEAQTPENPQPGLPLEFSTSDKLVRKALLLMRQNVATPLTVDQLSKRLGISRRKLQRHFGEALQLSPAEAGIAVRLNVARQLLRRTDQSVTHIAAATGFCDASHFSKVFRAREGVPPETWRRQAVPEDADA
ncbi:HTH-type transcriptional regulator [Dinoroseobacter shibae DFL 12 = DSM 16493]|jgi:transcriptional regulator GlxA family with amidase domain|uniref:HTH-type transcriptional regulator n=1 Tax=Dinoroseobacter shibae (strain DSM 16493 / NCIMB 14021 / DFL 12) TaxID=398580 RepID=A8LQI7_DINSH|nr:GlxA family transcriptional regulator [Dinoroseobacter shibae]ABV93854.1 HTH-type transcriptional regulator [Dinoroseobacter shibae DFL 12 = DSM 16493]URF45306.1 GlxA family transcriptional regulator [Dinoroseobacter shibae]URF49611.1 GlxA family transcriptional regulator [Dinoroseobacter shibae]